MQPVETGVNGASDPVRAERDFRGLGSTPSESNPATIGCKHPGADSLIELVDIEKIEFISEIYPREESSIEVIRSYMQAINPKTGETNLPAIELALFEGQLVLTDGFHRKAAHEQLFLKVIQAQIVKGLTWKEIKLRAIVNNSKHGKYYSPKDKKRSALILRADGYTEKQIAGYLSITERTVRDYFTEVKKDDLYKKRKIVEKLLNEGKKQEQIAKETGVSQPTVSRWIESIQKGNTSEMNNEYSPENLKVYDLWRFDVPSNKYGKDHNYGTLDPQVIEHLIYYFTSPGAKCVDPAAGQGLFLDVCEKMDREGFAYDITPVNHRVIKNDVTKGIPKEAHGADFILLDLPYYNNKVREAYPDLETFLEFVEQVMHSCYDALDQEGRLAFVMQSGFPAFTPLIEECYRVMTKKFKCVSRITSPIPEHVSGNRFHVAKAKEEGRFLYCDRVIHVYEKVI